MIFSSSPTLSSLTSSAMPALPSSYYLLSDKERIEFLRLKLISKFVFLILLSALQDTTSGHGASKSFILTIILQHNSCVFVVTKSLGRATVVTLAEWALSGFISL